MRRSIQRALVSFAVRTPFVILTVIAYMVFKLGTLPLFAKALLLISWITMIVGCVMTEHAIMRYLDLKRSKQIE